MLAAKLKSMLREVVQLRYEEKRRELENCRDTIRKRNLSLARLEAEAAELAEWLEQIDGLAEEK